MVSIAADGRSGMSVTSSTGTALRAASVVSASARPLSSTAGWMPRARVRTSAIASTARRCASSTSWVMRARSTGAVPWSFSWARLSFMARATSCACVPSCRSRSMPRSRAAESSTTRARLSLRARIRSAGELGPSRVRMSHRSGSVVPRTSHGAARSSAAPAGMSRNEVARPGLGTPSARQAGKARKNRPPSQQSRGDRQAEPGQRRLDREVGAGPPGGRIEDPGASHCSAALNGCDLVDGEARLGGQLGDPGPRELPDGDPGPGHPRPGPWPRPRREDGQPRRVRCPYLEVAVRAAAAAGPARLRRAACGPGDGCPRRAS